MIDRNGFLKILIFLLVALLFEITFHFKYETNPIYIISIVVLILLVLVLDIYFKNKNK